MARLIPSDRLSNVIDAAARVFVAGGYRRTQMQDVADALGLAKGTLYGYATSKEALFAAALRYGDGLEPLPKLTGLPVPNPGATELGDLVASRLSMEIPRLALTRALSGAHLPATPADAATELSDVIEDLYRCLARNRVAIKLVDRCAPDMPELARIWYQTGRGAQMSGMETYLRERQATGVLTIPGPVAIVARTVVEVCVLWAVHCHFDPAPPELEPSTTRVDDDTIAPTIAALITRSLVPAHSPRGS